MLTQIDEPAIKSASQRGNIEQNRLKEIKQQKTTTKNGIFGDFKKPDDLKISQTPFERISLYSLEVSNKVT